jgi:23S rRNA G2445 N2-methylase RlmL
MAAFTDPGTIVVTCYPFTVDYLATEIQQLGFEIEDRSTTSISIKGTLNDCVNLNFHLRTASRVLYSLHTFPCNSMQDLYDGVSKIAWELYLETNGYMSVTSSSNHPDVKNTMFLNMRVKDAIADRFMNLFNQRPDSGSSKQGFSVHVLWKNQLASVSIDTSGEALSRHGYRLHPFKAPLQESLASAMIIASGWDAKLPFVNPMCGSGTLAIEAALMSTNRYPGMFRDNFAFMHIKGYDPKIWDSIIDHARIYQTSSAPLIIATDSDPAALESAQRNAETAGVSEMIRFEQCDFMDTPMPDGPAILILNPPYGSRLGDLTQLVPVYKRIGEFFKKRCSGKTAFVLTSEKDLAAQIGLRASRKIPFMNADLECRMLRYEMYQGSKKMKNPDSLQPGS